MTTITTDRTVTTAPQGGFLATAKAAFARLKSHNVLVTAAGIAFFGLLALVPLLVAMVTMYGIVADEQQLASNIESLSEQLDPKTADFMAGQLETIVESSQGATGIVTLVTSIVLALWSSSGALSKLMLTIGIAYDTVESDTRKGWQVRLLGYALTFGAVVLVGVLVAALGVIPVLLNRANLGQGSEIAVSIGRIPLLILVFVSALTILYRYAPDSKPRTPWLNIGSLVGTVLFGIFAFSLSYYVNSAGGLPPSYGLLGTIAVLMIFMMLTAIAVIMGAEVNAVIEGTQERADSLADQHLQMLAAGTANGGPRTTEPIPFTKALAGVAALFFLGRGD
jgi:membrane protein